MLKLQTLPVGEYATNCYLLTCPQTNQALLVDPGADPEALLALCEGSHVTRLRGIPGPSALARAVRGRDVVAAWRVHSRHR
jgi:glyoxylase-like metal-dependent hydrolase (beta-lactamase superfamily II)